MFGNAITSPLVERLSCRLYGDCMSPEVVSQFKQVPNPAQAGSSLSELQFGVHRIPVAMVENLVSNYWPVLVGTALIFVLTVLGKRTETGLALGLTLLVQGAVALANH